ncbi:CLUMA_CG002273, isoform A [Clunio marinus]|uniref:CLUMA_CG002273, isoform A n=1 Tax=Clunio marinus TaxID=568069 RepID=A0A1J1HKJ0_9DIPT|nr:CLUMA_CG002273, isoform A [Clunio marinus]
MKSIFGSIPFEKATKCISQKETEVSSLLHVHVQFIFSHSDKQKVSTYLILHTISDVLSLISIENKKRCGSDESSDERLKKMEKLPSSTHIDLKLWRVKASYEVKLSWEKYKIHKTRVGKVWNR